MVILVIISRDLSLDERLSMMLSKCSIDMLEREQGGCCINTANWVLKNIISLILRYLSFNCKYFFLNFLAYFGFFLRYFKF